MKVHWLTNSRENVSYELTVGEPRLVSSDYFFGCLMARSCVDYFDRLSETRIYRDTIFFWSDPVAEEGFKRENRLHSFLFFIEQVILRGMVFGIPLRAGLPYGEVYIDAKRQLVVGQPVVDAYVTENSQLWLGAALHESFPTAGRSSDKCVDYDVPTKPDGPRLRMAVDWTYDALLPDPVWGAQTARRISSGVLRTLERRYDPSLESNVQLKYENTMRFLIARRDDLARREFWRGGKKIQKGFKWVPKS